MSRISVIRKWQRSVLRGIVRTTQMMARRNDICREPLSGARHAHCGGVGRTVPTSEVVVLVGFSLESSRPQVVTTPTVMVGQSVVPIEEVQVGLSR